MPTQPPITLEDLINRIQYAIDDNGCWIVTSHKYHHMRDYITISIKRRAYSVHRLMYMAVNGPIPQDNVVCHTCDNSRCINHAHLFTGTKADNSKDMTNKGRQDTWKGGRAGNAHNKKSVLTDAQVIEIKNSPLSSYALADIYPVSSVQIRRIRNGSRCRTIRGSIV